ncbi:hypothetical protein D3C79_373750 [compost metagenome]
MAPDPGIHQHIARPGIETAHRRAWQQQRKVGDAANIEHHTALYLMRQQRLMKCRYQRSTLAAVGHIAAAEIADGGDIGQCGNAVVIAKLHREARIAFRLMPHRLAMTTNSGDVMRRHAGLFQQTKHRLAKQHPKLRIQPAHRRKRGLLALAHTENVLLQLDRHRVTVTGLLRDHSSVDCGEHHIDAIQTGARHNTYIAA